MNDKLNGKCYCTILKRFFKGKKIPCIPPLLHEDKFVTDFQVCRVESRVSPQLLPDTNTCLSTVRFSENDILKVIRKLDIRMLKLSDKAFCKPLH